MADQFQAAGSHSSESWWSTARPGSFVDGLAMATSLSYCSTELANIGGRSFNCATAAADLLEAKSGSCDESPASISNSSVTFQDIHNSHASAPPVIPAQAMDFDLSSPNIEWRQPFFGSSGHASLVQEDVISSPATAFLSNQNLLGMENSSSSTPLNTMNQSFLQEHHFLYPNVNGIPLRYSSDYGLPSTLLHGLDLESDNRLQTIKYRHLIDHHQQLHESLPSSLPQLKASPPKQQLQFSNDTPFWNPNPRASDTVTQAHSNFHHARPPHLVQDQISSNPITKTTTGGGGSCSTMEMRRGCEPAPKKPRIETPSPLPTFKVRKEKLGDRITALQQVVSPFGKTDTASVLHEAIEYIKFLHDQVRVLSAPYLKNSHQMQQVKSLDKSRDTDEGQNEELKSRGLCLVPISSTFAVANEIPAEFWTPTFIGTFR